MTKLCEYLRVITLMVRERYFLCLSCCLSEQSLPLCCYQKRLLESICKQTNTNIHSCVHQHSWKMLSTVNRFRLLWISMPDFLHYFREFQLWTHYLQTIYLCSKTVNVIISTTSMLMYIMLLGCIHVYWNNNLVNTY